MANNSIAGKEEKKIKGTEFIDEFSKEIYEHTYSYENEDINQTHLRIAKDLAKIENDQKYWENQFLWAMEDFKFVPGGRIISNAGTGLEGTTYINCFKGGSLVLTNNGYKKIEDCNIDDFVLTHKGRFRKITATMNRMHKGVVDRYSSSLLTDDIIVTKEHPFYQGNEVFIKSDDNSRLVLLLMKDELQRENKIDLIDFIDIKNIRYDENSIYTSTEFISGNGAKSNKNSQKVNRFIEFDKDLGYLLGRFVGDGSTWKQNKKSEYFVDSFNIAFSGKEINQLNRIKDIIEKKFGILVNINQNKNGSYYIRKTNPILSLFLSSICGKGFDKKQISNLIWESPADIRRSFLIGLIDADGTVTKEQYIKIGLNNEALINDIQALLNGIGIPSRKNPMIRSGIKQGYLLYINKFYSSNLIKDIDKIYEDSRLDISSDFIDNGLHPIEDYSTSEEKIHTINGFLKTQEDYNELVYNISVEEDQSYIINNVIVHNCFVDGFMGDDRDSMEGILSCLRRQALILKSEGGYGFCADTMRPRGTFINGIGSESPGAVRMLDMWDTQSSVITEGSGKKSLNKKAKGKIRKGAQMVTMSVWHPDIEEFIKAKQTPGKLTKFNMSVLLTDDFMNAVQNNNQWNLEFPDINGNIEEFPDVFNNRKYIGSTIKDIYKKSWDGNIKTWKEKGLPTIIYKTYEDANELYDIIMQSTYNRNEPGVLFVDTINRLNNLSYCEYISATNPCLTKETLVYVADGRGFVSIGELADKGEDVQVFCLNENGKIAIRTMRNPRITGYNQQIYKVTLDDGNIIRATGNHKLRTKEGNYKEIKDLKYGDSLYVGTRYEASLEEIWKTSNSRSGTYLWNKNGSQNESEHRLIAEFYGNGKIPSGYVVHHKDFNGINNRIDNLEIMSRIDHDIYHGKLLEGDNNPMRRAHVEWDENKWGEYHKNMSKAVSGEKNGMYFGVSNDELREHALILTKKLGYRFSTGDWMLYAKENKLPDQFSRWRNTHFGGILGLGKWAALECGFDKFIDEDPRIVKNYKKYTSEGYNCRIEKGGLVYIKKCEICGNEFETLHRENSVCGRECGNKATSLRNKNADFIEKCTKGQRLQREIYKNDTKDKQAKVYSDLKFRLKRDPFLKEWNEECKNNNLPYRLGKSSPFKNLVELKEAALSYNHKVISVELDGFENVYNGTVDEFHNFMIGGFESKTSSGKRKWFIMNNLQCGEQVLPTSGVCLLGSINLTQFIDFDNNNWDYNKLKEIIPIAVRFMDNVNDITNVPLESQKNNLRDKRRIGLGIMGYGSALMILKIRYGSEYALKITEELMYFIANNAYQASSLLAKEKGSFVLFDNEKYLESNFIKNLSDETREMIRENGIRNSHLLSIQPNGNSSIFANIVSGGLEPVFMPEYIRTTGFPYNPDGLIIPKNIDWDNKKILDDSSNMWVWIKEGDENLLRTEFGGYNWKIDRMRGLLRETIVKDYAVRYLEGINQWDSNSDWAATTTQLGISEHVSTMSILSKYIDSAMSKTLNLTNDYPYSDFKELYMNLYKAGTIKGGTTYRAGTMSEVLGSVKKNEKSIISDKIIKTEAPIRPKTLPCDIYYVTTEGKKWIVLVGILLGDPYEVFTFMEKSIHLPSKFKNGNLTKIKKGRYDLETEGIIIENVSEHFETTEQEALSRMISTALRHGADIRFIVEQLNKAEGNITAFAKAIARTIKRYIQDGARSSEICPNCGSKRLVYQEGCVVCLDCSVSKC